MDDPTKQGISEQWSALEERVRVARQSEEESKRLAGEAFTRFFESLRQSARAIGIEE